MTYNIEFKVSVEAESEGEAIELAHEAVFFDQDVDTYVDGIYLEGI